MCGICSSQNGVWDTRKWLARPKKQCCEQQEDDRYFSFRNAVEKKTHTHKRHADNEQGRKYVFFIMTKIMWHVNVCMYNNKLTMTRENIDLTVNYMQQTMVSVLRTKTSRHEWNAFHTIIRKPMSQEPTRGMRMKKRHLNSLYQCAITEWTIRRTQW